MCSANSECRNFGEPDLAVLRGIYWQKAKAALSIIAGLLSAFLFCDAAVGQTSPRAFSSSGSTRSPQTKTEKASSLSQAKLTASDGQQYDQFGFSSAISGDTVVIGLDSFVPFTNHNFRPSTNPNEVYVFVKPASGWTDMTETAKLTPSDGPIQNFGYSVAVDGDTVIVGAPGVGGVYVYVKPASGWTDMTETARLTVGANGGYTNGYEVAINGDTIVSGSALDAGQDFLFVKPPGGWQTTANPTTTLTYPAVYDLDYCGICVSVSGDTVAIGVPGNFEGEGTVYVFEKPSTGWPQTMNPTATLIASDAALYDSLGESISVNANTVVAGAPNHADVGAIYVFEKPNGGWVDMTQTAELVVANGGGTGTALALTANGQAIVAGSPLATVGTNQSQGATYVFAKPKSGWKTTKKFNAKVTASDGAEGDQFGTSLGISDATMVTGAPNATVNGNNTQGAAYVFTK